jgi:hypothetical protein
MNYPYRTPHSARATNSDLPSFTFARFHLLCGPSCEYLLYATECPFCSWRAVGTHAAVTIAERSHVCTLRRP